MALMSEIFMLQGWQGLFYKLIQIYFVNIASAFCFDIDLSDNFVPDQDPIINVSPYTAAW